MALSPILMDGYVTMTMSMSNQHIRDVLTVQYCFGTALATNKLYLLSQGVPCLVP